MTFGSVSTRKNILFTATFSTPFIRTDRAILERHHTVRSIESAGPSALFRYIAALPRTEITFSWFASVYSSILILLTKVFGKRSILILGGVDVAKLPDVQYGIWNSTWRSVLVRYGIMHADIVLAVDPSIKQDAMTLCRYDGANIIVSPTGHDTQLWSTSGQPRNGSVLTVATCNDMIRYRVKGIDFLYAVAAAMPETRFTLIGMTEQMRQTFPPPANLTVLPPLPQEALLGHYRTAGVYFQPSLREALGSTLCEAMLCECYPVGTKVGGIPTVIGSTGSLVPHNDVPAAVGALNTGLRNGPSAAARQRIIDKFSIALRETSLLTAIGRLHV
ncbi:MAG: glycosyltransferase family 4 protein [Bacteroidetes bacterium]|nr:glycosyltransferase family 4 protein [Bacteroidota bacterium]